MTTTAGSIDPRTPVVVGVGQLDVPADEADLAIEPVDLMDRASRAALADAGGTLAGSDIDTVWVVAVLSWRYRDAGALLARRLGALDVSTGASAMGGNSPQMLVNRAALDIQAGRREVVLITGAETWRTRNRARREGVDLPWTSQSDQVDQAEILGGELEMSHPAELARGITMPVQAYPIFEVALRAASGRSPDAHLDHIAELWARFSEVAATNPHASVRDVFTAERLRTPSSDNRWVGYPYTKWMVSNDRVDQGAALVVCSAGRAEALGISRDRWVFPWSGTDTVERTMSERRDLHRSPAIEIGGRRALELAGVGIDDLGHVDLYSCFPSAVQIGAEAFGLPIDGVLTVTGGLTFAGGPWNNYVTHSIATMADILRDDAGSVGLCTANGGLISKHSFGVYSTEPPAHGFRHDAPRAEVDAAPQRAVAPDHVGPVTVEAYTVMHGRDGQPERALAACLTPKGRRTWATSDDTDLMAGMVAEEGVGLRGHVDEDGHLRLN